MRAYIFLTFFCLSFFVYGFYLSQTNLSVVPRELSREVPLGFYDYRGVINVRSNLSNGSSSPQEIISDAKNAGLDFLILTDRNQYDVATSAATYSSNLLVLTEGEYSFLDSRLMYISSSKEIRPESSADANIFFADLLSQRSTEKRDSLLVMAHPFNPQLTWTGSIPTGMDGLEVLNPRSISQKAWLRSKADVMLSLLVYPFNPRYSFLRLFREPSQELALWDQVSQERRFLAFAGSDASARAIPLTDYLIKFPAYQKSFELLSNHVLLPSELNGNVARDRGKLLQAIKAGNFYLSLDMLGDPKGFIAYIQDKTQIHLMGSDLRFHRGLKLVAQLPAVPKDFYEIVVYRNGESVYISNEPILKYQIKEPGVYRILVRVSPFLPFPEGKKWFSWIYTNNFYVK
ncbi:MAG: hypothetical protein ACK5RO_04950 [Pseudobdellovibrionaceae bacterium]|jgi:hypothetical protein